MSALDTLRELAGGTRPASGLLHNCRFEGLGIETYGVEAIVARLRMAPFDIATDAQTIETLRHIAVFDGDRALFADLYDGNIARLWVLGSDGFGGDEPLLDVPFDPDLSQGGGDVFFAGADHPDLAPEAARQVEAAGQTIVAQADGPRTRAFALRAFGSANDGAALFAVFRLRLDQEDIAGFHLVAARWDSDSSYVVRDFGSEATLAASRWTPRIGA
jgi:hypothetical protein